MSARGGEQPRGATSLLLAGLVALAFFVYASRAQAQVNVLMHHNDLARTGQNLNETLLTPSNVNTQSFGLLFTQPVDGEVYAQPLYLSQVDFPDHTTHNLVFVVTAHDSVFAFDADSNVRTDAQPIWHASFTDPAAGITSVPIDDIAPDPVSPEVGITSTPVIDPDTQTIYVVARTKEAKGVTSVNVQRLHALDVRTGAEKFGGPVEIRAATPGRGAGADENGLIAFNPLREHQRAALLLSGGVVYICWASIGDILPYHGWVIGYDAQTLRQVAVIDLTPTGSEGGIWQSGGGPAVDEDGALYVVTGNGTFDETALTDWGSCALRLTPTADGLSVADYYAPYNYAHLDIADEDLGSGGPVLLPALPDSVQRLLVFAGKEGKICVADRAHLGGWRPRDDSQLVQALPNAIGPCFATPAYFNQRLYFGGVGDRLKAFAVNGGLLSSNPVSRTSLVFGYPGPTPSVSADGTNNAIVWALENAGFATFSPTVLHAYDANDLSVEFYNSSMAGSRDVAPQAVRFTVPTVANGKVYVPGRNGLAVYGSTVTVAKPAASAPAGVFTNSVSVALSVTTPGAVIYYTLDGSDPTPSAALYADPLTFTNSVALNARAFKAGVRDSDLLTAVYDRADAIGMGSGLRADYYSNLQGFDGPPTLTEMDPLVDFNWLGAPPADGINPSRFSARWAGAIQAQFSETYTFYALASDGARLTVDDTVVIDRWADGPPTESSGTIDLEAGQSYDFVFEYYAAQGPPVAQLRWSSPSTPKAIIPTSQLFPATNGLPWLILTSPAAGAAFTAPASVPIAVTPSDSSGATVEFFADGAKIGEANGAPYVFNWTNVPAGAHEITVRSTDVYGEVSAAGPVDIVVAPLTLQAIQQGGQIILSWSGSAADFILESSATPNLSAWTPVNATPAVAAGRASVAVDLSTGNRFYRLRQP